MPQQIDSFISHIKWPAPAKLNLFLYITGRRTNGYHDLTNTFSIY